MGSNDAERGTERRRYYRIVISRQKWRWLPEVFVTAPLLRYSDSGRRVLAQAQEEARRLSHHSVGTEHLLLGLLQDDQSAAARALESLGISVEAVCQHVEGIIGMGYSSPPADIPFIPRAMKVLDLAHREAARLGDRRVGPEHILLGLIAEGEGVANQVLVRVGADLASVRRLVLIGPDAETQRGPAGNT
jgi:ATP-dependent Clp protease ATP-binding subunit ClpC